jgi:hypothetical protein
MKLSYFPNQCALNSGDVVQAFLQSCSHCGIDTVENSWSADAVVIWSVLWNGRMAANRQVYQHYRSQGLPVIIIETGALRRGHTWKIAINNITSQGYYGHENNLDPGRPDQLGIQLLSSTPTNPGILIAAQHSCSHQLAGVDQESWITSMIDKISAVTDRKIYVRPHPRSPINRSRIPNSVQIVVPKKLTDTYDSFDLDVKYHAVINYNSGPGIQAALSGIRTVVDASSLAHPVSIDLSELEAAYACDRHRWLIEIAHTEYTIDEIRTGIWLPRLASKLIQ